MVCCERVGCDGGDRFRGYANRIESSSLGKPCQVVVVSVHSLLAKHQETVGQLPYRFISSQDSYDGCPIAGWRTVPRDPHRDVANVLMGEVTSKLVLLVTPPTRCEQAGGPERDRVEYREVRRRNSPPKVSLGPPREHVQEARDLLGRRWVARRRERRVVEGVEPRVPEKGCRLDRRRQLRSAPGVSHQAAGSGPRPPCGRRAAPVPECPG